MKIFFCAHSLNSIIHKDTQRYETLRALGHEVTPFPFHGYTRYSVPRRALFRAGIGRFPRSIERAFNGELRDAIRRVRPDVVWIEKALLLLPDTIDALREDLPDAVWASYQDDNPFGTRRYEIATWRNFIDCIPKFDIHFVKRPSDVINFTAHHARKVQLSQTGFYRPFYHPYPASEIPDRHKHDVVFIGTAIDSRVAAVSTLLDRYRLPVAVYGGLWNRHLVFYRHRRRFHGFAGLAYAQIISGSKISLGYVSSSNFDEYNGRSVEIPACGGFLLAERTPKHLELYVEGIEAEFFSSAEECASKAAYYLNNESARARVALAGYNRCQRSDYSLARTMREALAALSSLREAA